ncbi:MAG TPA: M14 family zinc carboxypeptidase [Longimicrobiaceae bacterium]|nr:M14 family zinc carboxypeptidase [Longimicrobiaceae bacterium]
MRTRVVFATLLMVPTLAVAQQSELADETLSIGTEIVPQTFDWAADIPIPATTPWGQPINVEGTRLIRSWTTMPEYTNAMVDYLIEDPQVVSPSDHFGAPIGQPGNLHRVPAIYEYFRALDESTPRVVFDLLGETEEGNNLALVKVGSERNLARLAEIKSGLNALADPRVTTDAEAQRLIDDLPAVYTFYAGLHSTETGPPEMVMELAYRLAVSNDPTIQMIRDSVVVFIVPVAEPDGRNRVVDWHRRHNQNTFHEDDRVPGPPYWGKYIFHDNNRDGLQLSARLTQELVDLFNEWKYPLGHDLHESVPYLYVSTGTGPYNPNIDPIAIGEWQWMANYEVTDLTAKGMPGVWTHGYYDGWYPGYLLWVTNTRNAVGRFYETFGNSVPNTMQRTLGEGSTGIEWYRPLPPRDTTMWSLRNNTNYMESGVLSVLSLVARNRHQVMDQYWTKVNNSLDAGMTEAPYAYVVPVDQPRRDDVEYMLNLLRRQGIEVHQAEDSGDFGEVTVEEGDYVVRMDQPYRNFVKMIMEVQNFPADAPRPYDDVGWTFPYMFNIEVATVDDPAVQDLEMHEATETIAIPGTLATDGGADWYVVVPEASAHSITARYALGDAPVWAAEDTLLVDDRTVAPGAWLIQASAIPEDRMAQIVANHGLTVRSADDSEVQEVTRHEMDLPRIAILHSWRNTQDGGWARYAFDQMGVPYNYVGEDKIGEMDLRAQFDVIVFPSQGGGADGKEIFQGVDPEHGPLAYTRTAEYPTHGFPDSTEDMTGGMGYNGLAALRDFVETGGTFITLGSASTLPVEFGLVREVSLDPPSSLFVPGSIVRGVTEKPLSPIMYGYGDRMPLYHRFGPYFSDSDEMEENVLLRYAPTDSVFMSGLVENPEELSGEPAIIEAPVGEGKILLFGFNPLHRYQSHGNFAFVWNAIMNWDDL